MKKTNFNKPSACYLYAVKSTKWRAQYIWRIRVTMAQLAQLPLIAATWLMRMNIYAGPLIVLILNFNFYEKDNV